jgi:hypothetical protein
VQTIKNRLFLEKKEPVQKKEEMKNTLFQAKTMPFQERYGVFV